MSEAYIGEARRHLKRWCWINFIIANGEAIPLGDESQDAVTSIFMFHELPPKVRRIVFRELARVLKRGGRLVLVDSLQIGDEPDYDGMLELFPQGLSRTLLRQLSQRGLWRDCDSLRPDAYP
jgi:ubiquinone/menaquinone biosynthesis C-methylase UbiE